MLLRVMVGRKPRSTVRCSSTCETCSTLFNLFNLWPAAHLIAGCRVFGGGRSATKWVHLPPSATKKTPIFIGLLHMLQMLQIGIEYITTEVLIFLRA
jgi:hypothetical protein